MENEKVKPTIDLADGLLEQNLPVVIFCNYKEPIDKIKEYYGDRAVVVDGRTPNKLKQKYVDDFQDGEVDVFIGNIKASGVGITLTRSHNVIFCGYDWSPNCHSQAEDRVHRIGQTETCVINYVYAKNAEIDQMLTAILDQKQRNSSAIIDNKEESFDGKEISMKKLFKIFYKSNKNYEKDIENMEEPNLEDYENTEEYEVVGK
ncbi:MAG: C-terminal helicase domain-containing protein [Candidatus Woesearchaeota archaeon]